MTDFTLAQWTLPPLSSALVLIYAAGLATVALGVRKAYRTWNVGKAAQDAQVKRAVADETAVLRAALDNANAALVSANAYIRELERAAEEFEKRLGTANSKALSATGAVENLERDFREFKRQYAEDAQREREK